MKNGFCGYASSARQRVREGPQRPVQMTTSQQNSGNLVLAYDSTMIERAVVAFAVEDRISDG